MPVSSRAYEVNVRDWTCNCGRQKYSAHILCKHLVQAVPPPPATFFIEVTRRRTLPFYRHQALHAPGAPSFPPINDGSISDGDDSKWVTDRSLLEHVAGWRSILKRTLPDDALPDACVPKRARLELEQLSRPAAGLADISVDDSSPEDDELEANAERRANYAKLVENFAVVGEALKAQIPHDNAAFQNSMLRHFGQKVGDLVVEIRRREVTGRSMPRTWARGSNILLGYNSRHGSVDLD